MEVGTFITAEQVLDGGIKVSQSVLPAKDEDRTVVLPFEHGTMIAIFDGVWVHVFGLDLTSIARPLLL